MSAVKKSLSDWLVGSGRMTNAIRCFDWNLTPLGKRDLWPEPLRNAVNLILASPFRSVIAWSENGIIIFNDAYTTILGDKTPHALGKPLKDVIPEIWPSVESAFRTVLEHRETVYWQDREFLIPGKDGSRTPTWFTISHTPIHTGVDHVGGTLVTLIETSERKRVQQELADSEKFYRSVFDNMLNGLAYCEMHYDDQDNPVDFTYVAVNDAFIKTTGMTNAIGQRVSTLLPGIRKSNPRLFEIYGRVARGGLAERFETYVAEMNEWFVVSVFSPRHNHFVAIFDIITERKKAEQKIIDANEFANKAIASSQLSITIFNAASGDCVKVNEVATKLIGVSEQGLLKQNFRTLSSWKNSGLLDAAEECIRADKNVRRNIETVSTAGKKIQVDAQFTTFNANSVKYLMVTLEDISLRKRLESELRSSIAQRDEFMSVASHELKSPITALLLQLQILERLLLTIGTQVESKIVTTLQGATNAAKSLAALVNELLDVTRIRTGQLTFQFEEFDLVAAISDAVNVFRELAHEKGSTLIFVTPQPIVIKGDRMRLAQVLSNLIANAIKYGKGKPIEVEVTEDLSMGEVSICVKDYGVGISLDMQKKIFRRYRRVSADTKTQGLGLGLYIVGKILLAHGGTIAVSSSPGKGSIFTAKLPLPVANFPRIS